MLVENLNLLLRNLWHYLKSILKPRLKTKFLIILYVRTIGTYLRKTFSGYENILYKEIYILKCNATLKDVIQIPNSKNATIPAVNGIYKVTSKYIEIIKISADE